MFKKLSKKDKKQEPKFKEPKIKASREIKTHTKERTEIEKIFYTLTTQKRRTAFRQILDLSNIEMQKNTYMLLEVLLKTFIADRSIDKLFYTCFSKIIKTYTKNNTIKTQSSVKRLIVKYLIAQLVCDKEYLDFLEFMMRHFKDIVIESKNEIVNVLDDDKIKNKVLGLKNEQKFEKIGCNDSFYFTRGFNF